MNVMIAVDGSDEATRAAEVAVQIFGLDAQYCILSVRPFQAYPIVTPPNITVSYMYLSDTEAGIALEDQAEETAEAAAQDAGIPDAEILADVGGPGQTICRVAEDRGTDVIVLGAHDRGWWSRLVDPSVAQHVLDHAHCHVLLTRA